jgi:hypothetical protein
MKARKISVELRSLQTNIRQRDMSVIFACIRYFTRLLSAVVQLPGACILWNRREEVDFLF